MKTNLKYLMYATLAVVFVCILEGIDQLVKMVLFALMDKYPIATIIVSIIVLIGMAFTLIKGLAKAIDILKK